MSMSYMEHELLEVRSQLVDKNKQYEFLKMQYDILARIVEAQDSIIASLRESLAFEKDKNNKILQMLKESLALTAEASNYANEAISIGQNIVKGC